MLNNQLSSQGYVPFHHVLNGAGYQLYAKPEVLNYLNHNIQDDYTSLSFFKKLLLLSSNPRNIDAGQHKTKPGQLRIDAIDGILVDYKIESGCVCIDKIQYNRAAKKKHELPGLHLVKRKGKAWDLVKKYIKNVQTEYMAVNGQSNDREGAARLMPEHVLDAYGKHIQEFTLFHNPTVHLLGDTYESFRDKIGLTTGMTKRFARVLDDCQNRKKPVKTVAHSQGAAIYSEAVHYHNKTKGTPLDQHTVYFQGSAANMWVTKKILNRAGVNLHKNVSNANPIDPVSQVIGLNAITDVFEERSLKNLGRLTMLPLAVFPGAALIFSGNAQLSSHTGPYPGMIPYAQQVGHEVGSGIKAGVQYGQQMVGSGLKASMQYGKQVGSGLKGVALNVYTRAKGLR